jgi:hypothetical protein
LVEHKWCRRQEALLRLPGIQKQLKGIRIVQVINNRQRISIEIKEGIVFP